MARPSEEIIRLKSALPLADNLRALCQPFLARFEAQVKTGIPENGDGFVSALIDRLSHTGSTEVARELLEIIVDASKHCRLRFSLVDLFLLNADNHVESIRLAILNALVRIIDFSNGPVAAFTFRDQDMLSFRVSQSTPPSVMLIYLFSTPRQLLLDILDLSR